MKIKTSIYITCIAVVLLSISAAYFYDKKNNGINKDNYIKQNIETIIRIQYHCSDKKMLSDISTSDFINNLTDDFFKGFYFYKIDKNFMETCRKTEDDNLVISVRVEDWRGSYIQVFTLTKNENEQYLISKIQYDI